MYRLIKPAYTLFDGSWRARKRCRTGDADFAPLRLGVGVGGPVAKVAGAEPLAAPTARWTKHKTSPKMVVLLNTIKYVIMSGTYVQRPRFLSLSTLSGIALSTLFGIVSQPR
jgi:hypothetical protein